MTLPVIRQLTTSCGVRLYDLQLLRIDTHQNRARVGAKRRDGDRAGHVLLHQRPNDVLRIVGHQPQRRLLALQHQIADRHATFVQAHDHRRQRARRHARHGAIGHRHHGGLGHAHVRAGKERQLDQRHLLNAARLDFADAVDVLEQQLELVDDQAFHLRGTHAAVLQKDVDPRLVAATERSPPSSATTPTIRRRPAPTPPSRW